MIPRLIQLSPAAAVTGIVLLLACSTTTESCACSPPLAIGAVSGTILTSQQQPAAGAVVTFSGYGSTACDLASGLEPLFTYPDFEPSIVTNQEGKFATGLASINTGRRCVQIVAKADPSATDSTITTVQVSFLTNVVPVDTASSTLSLPGPLTP